ncbi:XdhC family protein [Parapusillimonas granuli]|uniref:XdhC family protein n=1 Tax=Parapusillimonas granuli TaxID=380911 RepID=A0A853FXS2_9BURK|nr:XdhC family protein [Parapusillimonas granuli]MBB5215675.1 xanthine dehydrogenase accessory factor [Parapusillimonas granuli]NYT49658.1 XdhC family protein [Parapusillimonas granuli]
MDSADFMVLRRLCQWRQENRHAALITVVHTWGSSPRPVGSVMAMRDDGAVVGSVSGGCIEDDLIHRHTGNPWPRTPQILKYGIDADEAHRFGLPCGGTVELITEFDPDPALLADLLESIDQGRLIKRELSMKDGRVRLIPADAAQALTRTDSLMSSVFGPSYRMLIIGAGQLSEYLATMAVFNGFSVAVCDPRSEYASQWSVPGVEILPGMPDDAVNGFAPNARTCIIALTHDPKLDDLALLSALHSDAFYVGAIGSRKNSAARRQRMIDHLDQTPESVQKLRSPVGIFIGSKTPAEIAVSIMAEVIAMKNGVAGA